MCHLKSRCEKEQLMSNLININVKIKGGRLSSSEQFSSISDSEMFYVVLIRESSHRKIYR